MIYTTKESEQPTASRHEDTYSVASLTSFNIRRRNVARKLEPWVRFLLGGALAIPNDIQNDYEPRRFPTQCKTGVLPLKVNKPECKADDSTPSNTEVRMHGAVLPLTHMPPWRSD
jgi:hypothetical protein